MKSEYFVSINGSITTGENAKISVFDRGFLYGDSVYESTRTFGTKVFRFDDHLERLFLSAKKIDLIPTISKNEIKSKTEELINFSKLQDVSIRIILTRGTNDELGLDLKTAMHNNLVIMIKPVQELPLTTYENGVPLTFYQKKSSNYGELPKTGNYQENILALRYAHNMNFFDSLMINQLGFVTEASTSNVWIIKDNVIYTPPLSDGLLGGLTRKTLFEMDRLGHLHIKLIEKSLTKSEVINADEVFLTSTIRRIVPVSKIDNVVISNGKAGENTLKILKTYTEFVR